MSPRAVIACLALCACLPVLAQEQGQYRSRILLTPEGEWSRGATLSVEELEQQLGSMEDAYARSSAGRHLARHHVSRGEYGKAVDFYRQALSAEGLSEIANREMLRELAQVHMLREDYAAAVADLEKALALPLAPEVQDFLLLARAQYQRGRYVQVVAALDRIGAADLQMDLVETKQALALYYRSGAFEQCESLLQGLLEWEPQEPRHWHLLASVYLQQDKKRQALDQLALAREKRVPFGEDELLLLADLQAVNGNPYGGAETLQAALEAGEVAATGARYRKLFEFWFQAREMERAQGALQRAATLSGDTELYLYLAQLQMEQESWRPMYDTMVRACGDPLQDRFVGRANLLLGVSQLKLGDNVAARRSFINATLIGGVNAQAGQWLDYMGAEPASQDEVRRIEGICHGAADKRLAAAEPPEATVEGSAVGAPEVDVKTVPPMHLFYASFESTLAELAARLRPEAVRLNVNLVKQGAGAEGPLHILFSGPAGDAGEPGRWQLGVPTRGSVGGRGRFRTRTTEPFRCAYLDYAGPADGLGEAMAALATRALAAGHALTGEGRLLLEEGDGSTDLRLQVQLGIAGEVPRS